MTDETRHPLPLGHVPGGPFSFDSDRQRDADGPYQQQDE
jgi:hypothetical protein